MKHWLQEIFITCKAIKYNLLYMDEWMEVEYPEVDWLFWPAGLEIQKQPLGVVGIIGPWDYPLQLSLLPLIAAYNNGNRVLLTRVNIHQKHRCFCKNLYKRLVVMRLHKLHWGMLQ